MSDQNLIEALTDTWLRCKTCGDLCRGIDQGDSECRCGRKPVLEMLQRLVGDKDEVVYVGQTVWDSGKVNVLRGGRWVALESLGRKR